LGVGVASAGTLLALAPGTGESALAAGSALVELPGLPGLPGLAPGDAVLADGCVCAAAATKPKSDPSEEPAVAEGAAVGAAVFDADLRATWVPDFL
jgi:hypothetical protein